MSSARKKKLLLVAGVVLMLAVSLVVFVLFADINAYKPRIEAAATNALGMDVKIGGRIGIVLLPQFGISLHNVGIRNKGSDIFFAEKVRVGLRLTPLIRREIRITGIELIRPRFSIERDKKGTFNFETAGGKAGKESRFPSFTVAVLSVSKGELSFLDGKSDSVVEAKGIDLTIRDLSSKGGADALSSISFTGDMKCRELTKKELRLLNLSSVIKAKDGEYLFQPVTMEAFKGTVKANISFDLRKDLFNMSLTLSRFSFEEFVGSFSRKKILGGKADLSAELSAKMKGPNEIVGALDGKVSMHGENLVLHQFDLDALLSQYEKSQSFNLVDVGAFVFAGPLGTSLTKEYDFAGVYKESLGGKGTIEKLVSRWEVRKGIAEARDVAFATKKNRIAVKGKIDFVRERFESITVAVLNEKGCAKFSQKIRGDFRNPQIDKTSILESASGPLLKLFEKTKKFVTGDKCEVFYSGSLPHPR